MREAKIAKQSFHVSRDGWLCDPGGRNSAVFFGDADFHAAVE
jgi:hypothetical protein